MPERPQGERYIYPNTLEEWIYDAETNIALYESAREDIVCSEKYQREEKLGKVVYKDIFKSAHHEVDEVDKKINWYKDLLSFLTELKQLRKEKEND